MAIDVTQAMDLTQAMQTLKWLDEERRKDKAEIATLQERVQEQERRLALLSPQIQQLQGALAAIQGLTLQVAEFEQTVSNYKNEMIFLLDQREETRQKQEAEAEQLRRIQHEALTSHMSRLEEELRALARYDEELNASRAEDQRLSEVQQRLEITVTDLSKRLEDPSRAVIYLEERRRADNRRVTELEHELPELRKRIEAIVTKFLSLEETIQKQKTRIEKAVQEAKEYEERIAELRISDFQREQKMKQYLDQAEQVAQELERVRVQTQSFTEQQQAVNRALKKLEGFKARLEKRQNETAERQRIAEERVKQQREEWAAARLKERKKQKTVIQERWRQQEQTNTQYLQRLDALRSAAELLRAELDSVWKTRGADATHLLKATQDVCEALTAVVRGEQDE